MKNINNWHIIGFLFSILSITTSYGSNSYYRSYFWHNYQQESNSWRWGNFYCNVETDSSNNFRNNGHYNSSNTMNGNGESFPRLKAFCTAVYEKIKNKLTTQPHSCARCHPLIQPSSPVVQPATPSPQPTTPIATISLVEKINSPEFRDSLILQPELLDHYTEAQDQSTITQLYDYNIEYKYVSVEAKSFLHELNIDHTLFDRPVFTLQDRQQQDQTIAQLNVLSSVFHHSNDLDEKAIGLHALLLAVQTEQFKLIKLQQTTKTSTIQPLNIKSVFLECGKLFFSSFLEAHAQNADSITFFTTLYYKSKLAGKQLYDLTINQFSRTPEERDRVFAQYFGSLQEHYDQFTAQKIATLAGKCTADCVTIIQTLPNLRSLANCSLIVLKAALKKLPKLTSTGRAIFKKNGLGGLRKAFNKEAKNYAARIKNKCERYLHSKFPSPNGFVENHKGKNKLTGSNSNKELLNPHGIYKDAPYHTSTGNSRKSPKPINGQKALDNSISFKISSKRRIAYSDGEFVVLSQTSLGEYHGHVCTWDELIEEMQNALKDAGIIKKNGKPFTL